MGNNIMRSVIRMSITENKDKRGQQFLRSLKDGRSVWIEGNQVTDLYSHHAFQGTLTTISRLFSMLDDPEKRDIVGFACEGRKTYAHSSFLVPRDSQDLAKRSQAFTYWARETHGMMSRLSDYARTYITAWYGAREQLNKLDVSFGNKIAAYYEQARDKDLFLVTAAVDPQIDRSKTVDDQRIADRYLHVVKETSEGVIVSGAKMIATAAPYAHDFIVNTVSQPESSRHSHVFIVSANSPGLHIICRESYANPDSRNHILSAKYDEMDAVLFFDNVLVPWERVLLYGDAKAVLALRSHRTTRSLALHQVAVRFVVKLEFVVGVAFAIAESIGVNEYLHVKERLGELLTQVSVMKSLVVASEAEARCDENGIWIPELSYLETAKNIATKYYPRAIELLQQVGGGGFVQTPSGFDRWNGSVAELAKRYFEGANISAEKKVRLFNLAWDLIGSPLGSRHELYERFYAGDPVRGYAIQYDGSDKQAFTDPIWKLLGEE